MPAKRILIAFMLVLVTFSAVHAQTISAPTILYFKADVESVRYTDVEAGTAAVNMSWNVVGLTADYYLQMHAWVNEQWGLVGEKFDAKKSDRIVIAHPQDFGLPTYRLSVVNQQGVIVASTFLQLHYLAPDPDERPRISEFSSSVAAINTNQLSDGKVFLPIHWAIDKRWAEINPVFEQVMPDGKAVSVELPRTNLWVPATSDGVVTPHTGNGEAVVLQMRLVDVQTDQTLDTRQISLPVSVSAPLTIAAVPDTSNGHASPPVSAPIVLTPVPPTAEPTPAVYDPNTPGFFFQSDIYDLTQSHNVTLSWNAPNAAQVWIEMHEMGTSGCNKIYHIPAQVYGPLSASGSLPVTIPDSFAIGAWFDIYVNDYGTAQCAFHGYSAARVTVTLPATPEPTAVVFSANATLQQDGTYESVPGEWVTLNWSAPENQLIYITGSSDFTQQGPLAATGTINVCPHSGGTSYTLFVGGEPGTVPPVSLYIYVPPSLEYPAYQAGSDACWNTAEAIPS